MKNIKETNMTVQRFVIYYTIIWNMYVHFTMYRRLLHIRVAFTPATPVAILNLMHMESKMRQKNKNEKYTFDDKKNWIYMTLSTSICERLYDLGNAEYNVLWYSAQNMYYYTIGNIKHIFSFLYTWSGCSRSISIILAYIYFHIIRNTHSKYNNNMYIIYVEQMWRYNIQSWIYFCHFEKW